MRQHPTCSWDHEVTREHWGAWTIHFVSCSHASSWVCLVNDIILQKRSVMSDFDACSQCLHLQILFCLFKRLLVAELRIHGPCQSEKKSRPKVLPFQVKVIQRHFLNLFVLSLQNVLHRESFGLFKILFHNVKRVFRLIPSWVFELLNHLRIALSQSLFVWVIILIC